MTKKEIIAGLKNALERGENREIAIQSFINAGYNEDEVREAEQEIGLTPVSNSIPYSNTSSNSSYVAAQAPSYPSPTISSPYNQEVPVKTTQNTPVQTTQITSVNQPNQKVSTNQNAQSSPLNSNFPIKKKKHGKLIMLIIILLILLGAFFYIIINGEKILQTLFG